MDKSSLIKDLTSKMDSAMTALSREFQGLRTGRASPELLNPVTVEAYGSRMPLNQVGNVNVPDARTLSVTVWDSSMVSAVEKSIREAGLGLNPATEGNTVRIPMPELNEERRKELIKVAKKYAESARVSVRNVRRDGLEQVKKADLPEDETRSFNDQIQKLTDDFIAKVDKNLQSKEVDIMQV